MSSSSLGLGFMVDLKRLWHGLLAGLHAVFDFISYFSAKAPLPLGYVLLVFAVLISLYRKRTNFYGGIDVAADWNPSYGGVVRARLEQRLYGWVINIAGFFGLMVLFQHYLPVLFEDIFGFMIWVTAPAAPATGVQQ